MNPRRSATAACAAFALAFSLACSNNGRLRATDGGGNPGVDAGGPPLPLPGLALPDAGSDSAGDTATSDAPAACRLAPGERGNAGCNFYAIPVFSNGCYVVYVVNPGDQPVHVRLAYHQAEIPVGTFGRRLKTKIGTGVSDLAPYDAAAGLPPKEALVLFLNEANHGPGQGAAGSEKCPVKAVSDHRGIDFWPSHESTGVGDAYHVSTDRPVVAYQFYGHNREGRGRSSATLLLPREAWEKTTVVATPKDAVWLWGPDVMVVAAEDDTEVRFRPSQDIVDVEDPTQLVRSGVTERVRLRAGEFVQFTAKETRPPSPNDLAWPALSGSVVAASKPVGVMGSSRGFRMPLGLEAGASHQQVPPLAALGHEYVAVRYPDRLPKVEEDTPWQIVGAADGTMLTYVPAPPKDAPLVLGVGQVAHFWSKTPFIVKSQDDRHPFLITGYMTGATFVAPDNEDGGPGAPTFVNVVPTQQYDRGYVFFIDPGFPDTRLVVVRKKSAPAAPFADVKLTCATAPLAGWKPLGDFEYAQVSLVQAGKPAIAGCDGAVHEITSAAPFAVTVWGWGEARNNPNYTVSSSAAYAYPAGAGAHPVNQAPPIVID